MNVTSSLTCDLKVMLFRQATAAAHVFQTLLVRDSSEDKTLRRMRRIINGDYVFGEGGAGDNLRPAVLSWSLGRAIANPDDPVVLADAHLILDELRYSFEEITLAYFNHVNSVLSVDQFLALVQKSMHGYANVDFFGVVEHERGEGRHSLFTHAERIETFIAGRNAELFKPASAHNEAIRWSQYRVLLADAGISGDWRGVEEFLFVDPIFKKVLADYLAPERMKEDTIIRCLTAAQQEDVAKTLTLYLEAYFV